ncbi:MAG: hypothetical protein PGN34_11410 [Methylobacterium frigidaeris]
MDTEGIALGCHADALERAARMATDLLADLDSRRCWKDGVVVVEDQNRQQILRMAMTSVHARRERAQGRVH